MEGQLERVKGHGRHATPRAQDGRGGLQRFQGQTSRTYQGPHHWFSSLFYPPTSSMFFMSVKDTRAPAVVLCQLCFSLFLFWVPCRESSTADWFSCLDSRRCREVLPEVRPWYAPLLYLVVLNVSSMGSQYSEVSLIHLHSKFPAAVCLSCFCCGLT